MQTEFGHTQAATTRGHPRGLCGHGPRNHAPVKRKLMAIALVAARPLVPVVARY